MGQPVNSYLCAHAKEVCLETQQPHVQMSLNRKQQMIAPVHRGGSGGATGARAPVTLSLDPPVAPLTGVIIQ